MRSWEKISGRSTSNRTTTEYKELKNSSSSVDFTEGTVHIGGRSLTYLQVGDPNGPLVLHNHGGPSSRLEAKVFASHAFNLGLRLVCVDRPGQGKSDPQHDRTFASWAADLEAIANAFEIDRFAVTGWSEGGLGRSRRPRISIRRS
jgi:alpha-beta hydrolase superfamily lysophospholipase